MALKGILKPGRQKLLVDLALTIAWLALVFLHPFFGYDKIISSYGLPMKGMVLAANFLFSMILFFPMSCGLVDLSGLTAKKKEQTGKWDLATAVFFVLFLNPVFLSCALATNNYMDDPMNTRACGAEITGFTEGSAARDAGMSVGEDIVSVDGSPVDTIDSFKRALGNKRQGDNVSVRTNKKEYLVSVQESQDKSARAIGVVLMQKYCPRK